MAGGTNLEYTPTWVVALVCCIIVIISLAIERLFHYLGKSLKRKNQKPLFEALQKVKEELMIMGFISLLLAVFQNRITKICISKKLSTIFMPCVKHDKEIGAQKHFQAYFYRHLLAEDSNSKEYCSQKDKAPLLSLTALHELHIFIFVLAVAHVTFCVLTIVSGSIKIHKWKPWEEFATQTAYDPDEILQKKKFTAVKEHDFIKGRFLGLGKADAVFGWLHSFFKQFFASVTRSDYTTLRLGFIMTHCRGNPKFNFHNYLLRALEADFKKVVGISWYLWLFVVIFLLLNISAWHAYFWISFIPLILLLAVGTKLEHIITELAHEVAEKHVAIEGDLVVRPSDDLFWFSRPKIVLILIHIILFQNSFEIAFLFFVWLQYGFSSCMMGQVRYIIPRLVIGVFVQVLCSYSTLPLYAIVTQMGSSFKKAIFDENIQGGLVGWAKNARKGARKATGTVNGVSQVGPKIDSTPESIQMVRMRDEDALLRNR